MLYNVIKQLNTKNILAIPADEGLADIAFQEGWRILIPAQRDSLISKHIERREAWEWGISRIGGVDDPDLVDVMFLKQEHAVLFFLRWGS